MGATAPPSPSPRGAALADGRSSPCDSLQRHRRRRLVVRDGQHHVDRRICLVSPACCPPSQIPSPACPVHRYCCPPPRIVAVPLAVSSPPGSTAPSPGNLRNPPPAPGSPPPQIPSPSLTRSTGATASPSPSSSGCSRRWCWRSHPDAGSPSAAVRRPRWSNPRPTAERSSPARWPPSPIPSGSLSGASVVVVHRRQRHRSRCSPPAPPGSSVPRSRSA